MAVTTAPSLVLPDGTHAGVIAYLAAEITTILSSYQQDIFNAVETLISILLDAAGLLALMFLVIGNLIQFKAVNMSIYLQHLLKYILIYSFVTVWTNFQQISTVLQGIPNDYATLLLKAVSLTITSYRTDILDPSLIHDPYSGMDEFFHAIVWIAWDFIRDVSISSLGSSIKNVFIGVCVLIIGAFFVGACAIITIVGMVGFAVAMSLAPLFIIMLMIDQTKSYFQNWLTLTIGFAVIPLLTSALMAVVLYCAGEALAASQYTSATKATACWPFLAIMVAAIVLLFKVPEMANQLTASMGSSGLGGGALIAAGKMAMSPMAGAMSMAMSMAKSGGKSLGKSGNQSSQQLSHGASLGKGGQQAGGSRAESGRSQVAAMHQSANARNERRDQRLAGRGAGGDSSANNAAGASRSNRGTGDGSTARPGSDGATRPT